MRRGRVVVGTALLIVASALGTESAPAVSGRVTTVSAGAIEIAIPRGASSLRAGDIGYVVDPSGERIAKLAVTAIDDERVAARIVQSIRPILVGATVQLSASGPAAAQPKPDAPPRALTPKAAPARVTLTPLEAANSSPALGFRERGLPSRSLVQRAGIDIRGGLVVEAVSPSGPAAGLLLPGDVVLSVDGARDEAARAAARSGPLDRPAEVRFWRSGVERSAVVRRADAALVFKTDCARGDARGCTQLAALIETADPAQAIGLFERGCRGGDPSGCLGRGILMLDGRGTVKDEAGALELITDTCSRGEGGACVWLGSALLEGTHGLRRDAGRAIGLLEKACGGGEQPGACGRLARALRDRDEARAAALLEGACDLGHWQSCGELADLLGAKGASAEQQTRASVLFDQACQHGLLAACTSLGLRYTAGTGVARDFARADALLVDACSRGHAQACSLRSIVTMARDAAEETAAPKPAPLAAASGRHWAQRLRITDLGNYPYTVGFFRSCTNADLVYLVKAKSFGRSEGAGILDLGTGQLLPTKEPVPGSGAKAACSVPGTSWSGASAGTRKGILSYQEGVIVSSKGDEGGHHKLSFDGDGSKAEAYIDDLRLEPPGLGRFFDPAWIWLGADDLLISNFGGLGAGPGHLYRVRID